jgi:outer membrane autotransporter protein
LASNPTLNVINYGGAAGGSGIILHAPSGITGSFGTVTYQGNGAATVTQTATDISLITVDGTPLVGSAFAASETGLDYLDAVNDEQLAGLRNCGTDSCDRNADQRFHLWAKGFGRFSNEAAEAGNQSFDYRIAGTAVGGDMAVADGLRLGVSFGYSNTEEDVAQHAASSDIDTTQASLYANYQHGPYFVTGQLSGGWQHVDQSRAVGTAGGAAEADSTTHGWLFGSSLQAGAHFGFPQGWWLTPSAGVSYQHQWVNGTTEHGGGASDVAIADHQADALRLKAQLVLSQDYQLTGYTITPHLKLGVQQQFNLGGTADGSFSDGSDFSLALIDNNRTMGLAGVGVQVAFDNGLSTYVDYDGALASGRTVQSITGGLRYAW